MRPEIKICGITQLEDARYCAGAGANYLGFIQHQESPRYVEPAIVRQIVDWVYGPQAVGVFVNETADAVNSIIAVAGFDLVQLHGEEPPEYCVDIKVPVIKTIHVDVSTSAAQLENEMQRYTTAADYFLLDTKSRTARGGTGVSFDWSILKELDYPKPLFLSGGLNADNIARAVSVAKPYAVDLSSGVESVPGRKDFEKVSRFFEALQHAELDRTER